MLQTKLEHMSKRGKPRWHMPPKPDLASDHMAMLTPLRLAAGIKAGDSSHQRQSASDCRGGHIGEKIRTTIPLQGRF